MHLTILKGGNHKASRTCKSLSVDIGIVPVTSKLMFQLIVTGGDYQSHINNIVLTEMIKLNLAILRFVLILRTLV